MTAHLDDDQPQAPRAAHRSKLRTAGAVGSATVLAGGSALGAAVAFAAPASAVSFTVTQSTDDGTGATSGTLSWAIAQANADPSLDEIGFDPSLSTITFSGDADQVVITESLSIVGPGSGALEIDYDGNCSLAANFTTDAALTVTGLTLTDGSAVDCADDRETSGGGLAVTDDGPLTTTLSIDDVTFGNNYAAYYGGGLWTAELGAVTITDSTFTGNSAYYSGGGAYLSANGPVVVSGSTFIGNDANLRGGGINVDVPDDIAATIVDTTFTGNEAEAGGGAHFETGDAVIRNSTFSGNKALVGGGLMGDTFLTLQQSTVTGNTATDEGGGVWWKQAYFASFDIVMSTISGNTADSGRGNELLANRTSTGTTSSITGSIVAGAAAGSSVAGSGYNPASDYPITVSSSLIGVTDAIDLTDGGGTTFDVTDPGLDALGDNGGPTQTMALAAGSPAIDAGPDPVPDYPSNTADQRGAPYLRVYGDAVDIGALEAQPEPVPPGPDPDPTPGPTPGPDGLVIPVFTG